MNIRRWLKDHSLKLLAIRDTPESIAGGVAIGFFFGFTPLFGIKNISAIFLSWLTGCNILAAVIAGALHDTILPLMPVIYRWEYDLGYWLLSHPHQWPQPFTKLHWEGHPWRDWRTFFTVGKPLLVGSVIFATPFSVATFFVTRALVARHQRKKALHARLAAEAAAGPGAKPGDAEKS